jgi:two-component system C4-dicarboxylate transport sensor histidine kinase DctB
MLDDCRELQDKGHAPPLSSHVQEFNSRRYDGSTFPSDIAVRGVQQRRGKKFIFTIYDVTERKNAQEILEHTVTQRTAELSQINEELKLENKVRIHTEKALRSTKKELIQASKLAALGKMASGISHEFNQPLMAVSSWLHNIGLLLDQGHRNEAEEALANIGTQVNRMIELASHIQTLARQPDLMFSPTDVCEVLERSLTLFQVRISQEGATVNRSHVAQPLIISTDGLRLEQVFINLVSNALDAMGSQDNKIITIDAGFDQNEKLSIRLSDSGPGIPEDIREHVFDPFFTTKKTGKGMGLGLSISYNIVHSLGGSLAVHNLESGGACFVLTLPIDGVNSQTPIQAEGIW